MKLGGLESLPMVLTSLDRTIIVLLTVPVNFRIGSVTDAVGWLNKIFPIQLHTHFSHSLAARNIYMICSAISHQVEYGLEAV